MRVLLLEDDAQLGGWIADGLRDEGYLVDHFANGEEALIAAMGHEFEVLILDHMVPGLNGMEVLKSLRASKNKTPALLLTALDDLDARAEGVEADAEGYLTKPFAFAEISALIRDLVQFSDRNDDLIAKKTKLTFGDLNLDLAHSRCERNGIIIELRPIEIKLLAFLIRRPGKLVTKKMLLRQVWGLSFDTTDSIVDTHIKRLRAKIDTPFGKALLKTHKGEGYVFGR